MSLRTVVIPAAGLGTRMLPATKSVPKELLPVYDTPLMHYALCEAAQAGAERIIVISHPSKVALETYLRPATRLERALRKKHKHNELAALRDLSFDDIDISIVHQPKALGLGHAVLLAKDHIDDDRFGVVLPDDLLLSCASLRDMADARSEVDCVNLVGAMRVPDDLVSRYGIFDLEPGGTDRVRAARGMVEKPTREDAPSNLAALGRYILSRDIIEVLEKTRRGSGGEIQLTDAIACMPGLFTFEISETRFDCGSKEGLLDASIAVRTMREEEALSHPIAAE